ncbi:MAG: GDP-mannose 4,6-dehydratase [Candidatus Omnitrophica bacterium]|nr:GDP-mannose 4,6-dehydratase [Candidatus Omnitrophota bacterium]
MVSSDFWKHKKVLVTGHEGFLGSWLTRILVESGAKVVGIDIVQDRKNSVLDGYRKKFKGIKGNIANARLIKQVIKQNKPQFVFHVAAEAIVGRANKNPVRTFKSNIEGTWNILETVRHSSFVDAVVVASSDKAYGSHDKLPYTEDAPLVGEHPYDVSKSCTDLLCYTYFKSFQIPVCVTRCGNIYGPGDSNDSRLVPDAIKHILREETFVIRSDGTFTRDYIFVKDIVAAYLLLAEKMKNKKILGEAFNFSCEAPLSVLDLLKKIFQSSGKVWKEPKILDKAKMEIKHQYLSSKKARNILKWKPQYTLDEGLRETIDWYAKT